MKGTQIIRIGFALCGLLAIAAITFSFRSISNNYVLLPESNEPGGTSAFVQLLEDNGYQVSLLHYPPIQNDPTALVLSFESKNPDTDLYLSFLGQHLSSGGNALVFKEPDSEKIHSPELPNNSPLVSYSVAGSKPFKLSSDPSSYPNAEEESLLIPKPAIKNAASRLFNRDSNDELANSYVLWQSNNEGSLNNLFSLRKETNTGTIGTINNGIIETNRFLGEGDNAKALLSAVKMLSVSKKIYIPLFAFQESETPTILDVLGDWAKAGWTQILVLFAVVVFTLGKRFGFPEQNRAYQASSRDLLDGIAGVYERTSAKKAAAEYILQKNDARIRERLGISAFTSKSSRNDILPPNLSTAFSKVETSLLSNKIPPTLISDLRSLEAATQEFLLSKRKF